VGRKWADRLDLGTIWAKANGPAMRWTQLIDATFSNGVQTSGAKRPSEERHRRDPV